jgi:ISXO2-like transposase domain
LGQSEREIFLQTGLDYPNHVDPVQQIALSAQAVPGSTVYADEATHWDALHARFLTKRINHSECYSDGEACTNQAESFFSRLRRAEIGIHHHVARCQ